MSKGNSLGLILRSQSLDIRVLHIDDKALPDLKVETEITGNLRNSMISSFAAFMGECWSNRFIQFQLMFDPGNSWYIFFSLLITNLFLYIYIWELLEGNDTNRVTRVLTCLMLRPNEPRNIIDDKSLRDMSIFKNTWGALLLSAVTMRVLNYFM